MTKEYAYFRGMLYALVLAHALVSQPRTEAAPEAASMEVGDAGPRARQSETPPIRMAHDKDVVPRRERRLGVHLGFNLGLFAVDLQTKHLYAMFAGNVGIPLLLNGDFGSFAVLIGYSGDLHRTRRGAFKFDLLAHLTPGFAADYRGAVRAFVGGGAVLGFRYETVFGLSIGFRIPLLGYASGATGGTAGGVGRYYLAALVSLPLFSVGYRF